jgi:hypothetical protein
LVKIIFASEKIYIFNHQIPFHSFQKLNSNGKWFLLACMSFSSIKQCHTYFKDTWITNLHLLILFLFLINEVKSKWSMLHDHSCLKSTYFCPLTSSNPIFNIWLQVVTYAISSNCSWFFMDNIDSQGPIVCFKTLSFHCVLCYFTHV